MNVYLKIALSAIAATYIAPRVTNSLMVPETTASDTARNVALAAGVTGAVTAGVFVVLTMAFGGAVPGTAKLAT